MQTLLCGWKIGKSSNCNPPPAYLIDSAVQSGIGALLSQDRGEEESHRLKHELQSMVGWVSRNLQKAQHALTSCSGVCQLSTSSLELMGTLDPFLKALLDDRIQYILSLG